eukprot:4255784-Pyramimonas_sp.AAC.1
MAYLWWGPRCSSSRHKRQYLSTKARMAYTRRAMATLRAVLSRKQVSAAARRSAGDSTTGAQVTVQERRRQYNCWLLSAIQA